MTKYTCIKDTPFNGWPSLEGIGLFEIALTPEQFEKRYGLKFKIDEDDLDKFYYSHFVNKKIGSVYLVFYAGNPSKNTSVFVDKNENVDEAIDTLIETFSFSKDDIKWQREPS